MIAGARRDVSLGKRTCKGLVVMRGVRLDDPHTLCSVAHKLAQGRMGDIEPADIRFLAGDGGLWRWLRFERCEAGWELALALPAGGEQEGWAWLCRDHLPHGQRPPQEPLRRGHGPRGVDAPAIAAAGRSPTARRGGQQG